jgi:putative MATE family efflux protein
MARDLTKGSVTGNLLAMSVPTMLGMVGQTLYDIVDLMWIGRISSEAVAGAALFSSLFWLAEVLNEVIGTSSVALITQAIGAKDEARASRVIEQTIAFKAFVAIIAAVLFYFGLEPALRLFSGDGAVIEAGLAYGRIRVFFLPIFFMTFSCFTALRCSGDPSSQMWILLASSALNAVLAPLFMFETLPFVGCRGLGLGVLGAGVATVTCISLSFAAGFGLLVRGRHRIRVTLRGLLSLDREIDRKLIVIGLPSGAEMLARQLAGLIATKFVALYGTAAIAALGIGNRLGGLVFMPLFGLMQGGGTIVGHSLGAEDERRAERTALTASLIGGATITVCMGLGIAFPEPLLRLFVDSPETVALGVPMMRILGSSFIVASYAIALACVFAGSGYNLPMLISSTAGRWGAQIPFLLLATYVLPLAGIELGIAGVWSSFLLSDLVESALIVYYYRKGDWKKARFSRA